MHREVQSRGRRVWAEDERVLPGQFWVHLGQGPLFFAAPTLWCGVFHVFLLLSGFIYLFISVTHPLCNLPPQFIILRHAFPKNGNLNPTTPKHPPTRTTHAHPAHPAHPGPRLLLLITASTLPWLLLLLPWKSWTNPDVFYISNDDWNSGEQFSLLIALREEDLLIIMKGYVEPGRKNCVKRSKKKCRSVNKRRRYFFIVPEVRGDHKINSCCTLLHVMTIFSVAEHIKNREKKHSLFIRTPRAISKSQELQVLIKVKCVTSYILIFINKTLGCYSSEIQIRCKGICLFGTDQAYITSVIFFIFFSEN